MASNDTSNGGYANFTTLPASSNTKECDLSEQLRKLLVFFANPKDREATLSTLKRIFDNIIQHPNDDKYRQIKLTDETFSSKVWQYPAGKEFMKMSGWVVEDDHVRLRNDSYVQIVSNLLVLKEAELNKTIMQPSQCTPKMPLTILDERKRVNTDVTGSNHFTFSDDETRQSILLAIVFGQGAIFKEIIKQYDPYFIQNVLVTSITLIETAFFNRQIGIARILVREYGANVNIVDKTGCPCVLQLFHGCDSTESCQALIIEFIKEFEIDVDKYRYVAKALHLAVLHKLFTVVKFLVEDCKVDVNCTSTLYNDGTALHMAYGIGEKNIAQYLIEHGADQDAIDGNGNKPKDYELCGDSTNVYSLNSKFLCMKRMIWKSMASDEYQYFAKLGAQGLPEHEAVDLTFKKFPSLQETLDGGVVSRRNLGVTPTLNELNRYVTDMAPSYYDIGLQLDIVNSQLRLIKNDPSFPDLKEKCRKMLEVWLANDTSATWKKLCDALQEVELSVLAERIKNSQ